MRYLFFFICVLLIACKGKKEAAGKPETNRGNRKKTLVAVHMKALRIEAFPKYDRGGENWDAYAPLSTDPDLFITLTWNKEVFYKSETHNESVFGTPLNFTSGIPCELKPVDQALLLEVFDEDGVSSNDNVGYFEFNLKDFKDWKTIALVSADKQLNVSMDLEWVYK